MQTERCYSLIVVTSCDKRHGKNGEQILSNIRFHKEVFLNPFMANVSFLHLTRRCFVKTLYLKISQNSQENICARVFFLK